MSDGPSQITDLGGLPYGGKQAIENMASQNGMSLGMQAGQEVPNVQTGPKRIAPKPKQSLGLGSVADFVKNSPSRGGLPTDKLSFGLGAGPDMPAITELQQQRKTAVDRAVDIFANTKIPAVRSAAAQIIRGAVISEMQGDDE